MGEALKDAVEAAAVQDSGKRIGVVRALEEPCGLREHGDEDASGDEEEEKAEASDLILHLDRVGHLEVPDCPADIHVGCYRCLR